MISAPGRRPETAAAFFMCGLPEEPARAATEDLPKDSEQHTAAGIETADPFDIHGPGVYNDA